MTLYLRLILSAVALALLVGWTLFVHDRGRQLERASWQAKEVTRLQDEQAVIVAQAKANEETQRKRDAREKAITTEYASALATLQSRYDVARRTNRLRIPANTGRPAAASVAPRPGPLDDTTAGELPAAVAGRLFDLAHDADRCSTQLTDLQRWIVESGLY